MYAEKHEQIVGSAVDLLYSCTVFVSCASLSTSVQMLANANISQANHMAVSHDQDDLLEFKFSTRTGQKCDLGDFEHGIVGGATLLSADRKPAVT